MPEPAKSVKANPWIRKQTTVISSFSPTEEVKRLSATQKTNQKIVLSFYGQKIDMPFKLTGKSGTINITTYLADMRTEYEVVNSYKVVITHPLGTTHFRLDVPKGVVASTLGTTDAFAIAELNMKARREFEDYLINRKQYDLEFSAMDLGHRQARLGRKYEYVAKSIDLVLGVAKTAGSIWLGRQAYQNVMQAREAKAEKIYKKRMRAWHKVGKQKGNPKPEKELGPVGYEQQAMLFGMGAGVATGVSGITSGIVGLISASERAALQEEGFAIQINEKALESYRIDLGFERQKEEQLFTMRRLFANQTYNDVTDRQRQKALDAFETPAIKDEIYLELWTTSDLQDQYVRDYHDKYGVDCRVVLNQFDTALKIHDEIRAGIYCIEDVVIENLSDRVELEFLKARLTGGIRFVEWVEHDKAKELTPTDKRILELQSELAEVKHDREEKERVCQDTISRLSSSNESLSHDLAEKRIQYHQLSESYREKEEKLSEQQKLVGLYRDEVIHLKQDLLKESSQHSTEKEDHSGTKQQLEQKKGEIEALTRQIDTQTQQIQQKESQISSLNLELATSKKAQVTAERQRAQALKQKTQVEQERDEAKRQLREAGISTLQSQIETLQQTIASEKELCEARVQEAQATTTGLRQIVQEKDREIQALKEQAELAEKSMWYLHKGIFSNVFEQADLLITGLNDKLYFCLFSYEWLCWQVAEDNDDWQISKYNYEATFRILKRDKEKKYSSSEKAFDSRVWENDHFTNTWPRYFGEKAKSFSWVVDQLKLDNPTHYQATAWLTRKRIKVVDSKKQLPVFNVSATSGEMTKETPALRICYYNSKDGVWSDAQDEERSLTQVINYGDYLDLLGLDLYTLTDGKKVLGMKGNKPKMAHF